MKISLNIEKKHFYSILGLLVIFGSVTFAVATLHNPGHTGGQILVEDPTTNGPNSLNVALSNVYSGGITGYTVVKTDCNVDASSTEYSIECTASCPGGKKVIGGGGYPASSSAASPSANKGCGIAHNGPTDSGNGWRIGILAPANCANGGNVNYVIAYAICVTA